MTLIEVLVAKLLLGLAVVVMISMQYQAIDATQWAYWQNQAMLLAKEVVSMERLSEGGGDERLSPEFEGIRARVNHVLPRGEIAVDDWAAGESQCVTIAWRGTTVGECTQEADVHRFCLVVEY